LFFVCLFVCLFVCFTILNFPVLILDIYAIGDLLIKLINERIDDFDYIFDVPVEMAAFSGRPDRFLGVHFFNPVQVNFTATKKKHVITEILKEKKMCRRMTNLLISCCFVSDQKFIKAHESSRGH
jgi:hypothetical protein